MEANNNEFKHKPRIPYSENSSSKDGASSNNGNQWHEGHKEHRRDHGKNRERGRDRVGAFYGKNKENFRDEESRDRFKEQPQQQLSQQPSTFPAYSYNTSDNSYVDNRHALSMMPPYNFIAAVNPNWGNYQVDGMPMAQNNLPVNSGSSALPMTSGMDMTQPSVSGMNPYTFMSMPGDNMYGMMGMGNYYQYGMMNGQENVMVKSVKETVHLKKSVLYPPCPNAPPPTTRNKPFLCKTIFVGGLPEKITEEIIREVFERCGEIKSIRMSKKNFCHIGFTTEPPVEKALYYSAYTIKIDDKVESQFTGRLHVDYAIANNDEREFECLQRKLQREIRHSQRLEQEHFSPPTPPPVVHYSEHEAISLSEKLRGEDTFQEALVVLIAWLERGECTKRNASSFYSMIQSTNSHVRRLMNEKTKYEEELTQAKKTLKNQMQGILLQFTEIEKVFNQASQQKVWDHFTKPQRKNIGMWIKQTGEIKNAHVEEVLNNRTEDEMDLSSDDGNVNEDNTIEIPDGSDAENNRSKEICSLREEVDLLHCQLNAAENEAMVMQAQTERDLEFKDRIIASLRAVLCKDQKNVSQKRSLDEADIKEYFPYKSRRALEGDEKEGNNDNFELDNDNLGASASTSSSASMSISENEVRLIGLISTFLHVHPFGANIDYICSYLHQIDSAIKARDVENLMKKFPTVFREDSTGIGASLGKKWRFLGFQS